MQTIDFEDDPEIAKGEVRAKVDCYCSEDFVRDSNPFAH